MPPLVRTLGLVLLLAVAGPLVAQTRASNQPNVYPAAAPGQDSAAGQASSGTRGKPAVAPSTQPGGRLLFPRQQETPGAKRPSSTRSLPEPLTVVSSLAVVLGLFLLVAWALKRSTPGEAAALPGEVLEVLGRKSLGHRQQLHLLRCGRKLILVSMTPDAAETLTEITDADEVDRLTGLCRQTQPGSATAAFRQVLEQFSSKRTEDRHA